MRRALTTVNLLVAVVSAALFAYTFVAPSHLTGLAREYVGRRTAGFAATAADAADGLLWSPKAAALPASVRDATRAEVEAFRRDPVGYVRRATDGDEPDGAASRLHEDAAESPVASTAARWREKVRTYFAGVYAALVADLRIFAGTNAIAALAAAGLARAARGRQRWRVAGLSALLLVATLLNASMYLDGITFFRLVAKAHAGWSYPVCVGFGFLWLAWKYGRHVPAAPPEPAARWKAPPGSGKLAVPTPGSQR
jgi:hypothetical protein